MLNEVNLIGRLGKDPEGRNTDDGGRVCSLSIATDFKAKSGEKQTEWHKVTCWGKTAELVERYCSKGKLIHVRGRLQTRKWTDKEGIERWTTTVVAERVLFLSGGSSSDDGDDHGRSGAPRTAVPEGYDRPRGDAGAPPPNDAPPLVDDDIPF
jgi:single-strand DNA-binding protein